MKRKRIAVPGMGILKWHMLLFIVLTSIHWLSVLATFEYPDNRALPFEMFRGFIVERIGYTLLWALLLLAHFGIQELRSFWLQRTYDAQLEPLTQSEKRSPKRFTNSPQGEDDEVRPFEEDAQRVEYL